RHTRLQGDWSSDVCSSDLLRDLLQLHLGDRADLLPTRGPGALLEPGGITQQHRRGRRLGDEGERPILEDGDLDGDDRAPLGLGLGVVHLAEVHDVHAMGTEGGADRGRGCGRAGGDLNLDDCGDALLRHVTFSLSYSLATWLNS